MIEYTMEELVFKSIMSLDPCLANEFERILGNSNEIENFSNAYEIMEAFLDSPYLSGFFNTFQRVKIKVKLHELKSVVALYLCYFAMEYCYHKENPNGEKLDFSYLKDYFDTNNPDDVRPIYQEILKKIDAFEKRDEFKDGKFVNPANYSANYHIYTGNIIRYLHKSYRIEKNTGSNNTENKTLYFHDCVPAITMIALKNNAYLPNGIYTNRSKTGLTGNFLNSFGKSLSGGLFFDPIKKSVVFNESKIKYKSSSKESAKIAKIINLMAVDDIYRLDRLNKVLLRYVEMPESMNCTITKNNAKKIAKFLSIYLEIPPFVTKDYSNFEYALFYALEHNDANTFVNIICPVFSFYMVTFPWIVGLSCFLLFYKDEKIKEVNEIKSIISELEEIVVKDYDTLFEYFKIDEKKIWSSENKNQIFHTYMRQFKKNKGSENGNNHHNNKIEWNKNYVLSFNELIELLLSTPKNILKTRNILDENGIKCPWTEFQKHFYFLSHMKSEYHGQVILARLTKEYLFSPWEYIALIGTKFAEQMLCEE